ncbi:MAG: phenylalanine--tRNA ligase subunit beta [Alphaproteobacteria bacterium]|nr:phenylalanine--tRNA ligase subunit beta [Alphaproteobacteria bacterium]
MKFTLSWLKDHLDTNITLDNLLIELVNLGLEVESVEDKSKGLENFVIVEILTVAPHPNADRLRLCNVTTGTKAYDVVCGAPNVYEGMKTVFADIGTFVPGLNTTLKKAEIRGVPSHGMLCSAQELLLGGDANGIMDLPKDVEIGQRLVDYLGLTDPVIDVSVTPNRPDWLAVRGIARDLAAKKLGTLKPMPMKALPVVGFKPSIKVHFKFEEDVKNACTLFMGRLIKNVQNKESPEWLKKKLIGIGLRPISAIVDITNFLTHDLCRPLHIFDADKIKGSLELRMSRDGETLEAIDNKTYNLDDGMTVITDDTGIISLAGIMGGLSTSCDLTTQNVFLEAALFDPIRTAQTGRKLGILSDARYRFERGIDPESVRVGVDYGTQLILEICGGEISDIVVTGKESLPSKEIYIRPKRFTQMTGIDLASDKIEKILKNLGCDIKQTGEKITLVPPSWRLDLQSEIDLIEDVLRLHGYHHLPTASMPKGEGIPKAILTPSQKRRQDARRYLANRGLLEIVTYSFMSQKKALLFGAINESIILSNPISADLDYMRPSILPNIMDVLVRNTARNNADLGLFEIGPIYKDDTPDGQLMMASGMRMGKTNTKHWLQVPRSFDVYDVKADFLSVLGLFGIKEEQIQFKQNAASWYHPGRSGSYYFGGKTLLGYFGEIHPKIQKEFDLANPVYGFEIFMDAVPFLEKKKSKMALELSSFQMVGRDFAFILDNNVQAQDVIKIAKNIDKNLVQEVTIFDVYQGDKLPIGKKSIALNLKLQSKDRTLKDDEIDIISTNLIREMKEKLGGQIRDQ